MSKFKLYLMYKPMGGIWVTMGVLTWDWEGTAKWDTQAAEWVPDGISEYGFSTGDNSTVLPQWDDSFTNLNHWVN